MANLPLILASSSKGRQDLLKQIGIIPDKIVPADIDEKPLKKEKFIKLVTRLASEKGLKISQQFENAIIVSADTIVICKGQLLDKAENDNDVRKYLEIASGAKKQIITNVCVIRKNNGIIVSKNSKLVKSKILLKSLTDKEIEDYVATKEGIGKSGGLAGNGIAASYIKWMQGSFSAIIGLPLYETRNLLINAGYDFKNKILS